MSRIPKQVSSPQWIWYISRTPWTQRHRQQTNPETLTRTFLQLLKQRSKKEKASTNQPIVSIRLSNWVYVSDSEICKQPSVDLVHISECQIHGGP